MNHGRFSRDGAFLIYRPDLTYLPAMKLRAARVKDAEDVLWLMEQTGIKARER